MDVVFSFDDTGSMASVRAQVRQNIKRLVNELFELDTDLRIGIIIHNDYCDKDIIKYLDLTNDHAVIDKFINSKLDGMGGDADECYELAINYLHSKMTWTSSKKIAILIGDCEPHEKGYKKYSESTKSMYVNELDWQDELLKCNEAGIRVYPIQALRRRESNYFYTAIGQICGTPRLDLDQFSHINQYITAIMYSEDEQLQTYEDSKPEFKTNLSLKGMFDKLKIKTSEEKTPYVRIDRKNVERDYFGSPRLTSRETRPVIEAKPGDPDATIDIASKFQILEVGPEKKVIRNFVEDNGATFKVGRGFYEFIKPELVQRRKEVLFVHKLTGVTKSDTNWCREQLGLPYGEEGKVNPKKLACSKEYDMFIQSTSYTRKLDANTKFLYELDHK